MAHARAWGWRKRAGAKRDKKGVSFRGGAPRAGPIHEDKKNTCSGCTTSRSTLPASTVLCPPPSFNDNRRNPKCIGDPERICSRHQTT